MGGLSLSLESLESLEVESEVLESEVLESEVFFYTVFSSVIYCSPFSASFWMVTSSSDFLAYSRPRDWARAC